MSPTFGEHDWATRHFTNWKAWTSLIAGAPGVKILEVGSFEGRSAVWWLEHVLGGRGSMLTCVDPWNWPDHPDAYERFKDNVDPWLEKVEIVAHESRRALGFMPDESYDVVYVDGSHEGRDACLDVLMSVPLLKVGGLLICDDYDWSAEGLVDQPSVGYDAALKMNCDRMEVFHCDYQLAARRLR